jgi:hypothetical protein
MKKEVKCHVFIWSTDCHCCSPYHYYEFEADFRCIVCDYIIKYIGVEALNDDLFVETDDYNENGQASFWLRFPIEYYDEQEFNKIDQEVSALADEHFEGWDFDPDDDDTLYIKHDKEGKELQ